MPLSLRIPCTRVPSGRRQVWDRADAATTGWRPTAQYADSPPTSSVSYDQISYANGHQVHLDRPYIDYPGGRGRFYTLFKPAGSRLIFATCRETA